MKRVAVIDNIISSKEVYDLTGIEIRGYDVKNGQCVRAGRKNIEGSHGNVCAALLAEFAPDAQITGISIMAAGEEDFSIENACTALSWCGENSIEYICMSIGTTNWLGIHKLAKLTKELAQQGICIISAVSQEGSLTFPACYPWIIGVSFDVSEKGMKRNRDFRWGYDISVGYFTSRVLDELCRKNLFFRTRTSSMAVPYVAGYLLKGGSTLPMQQREKAENGLTKENILQWEFPVVMVRNAGKRIIEILYRFWKDEYAAAMISDTYETDFVKMIIHVERSSELIMAMEVLSEASIVLVDLKSERESSLKWWDLDIDIMGDSIEEAYKKIRFYFNK